MKALLGDDGQPGLCPLQQCLVAEEGEWRTSPDSGLARGMLRCLLE